MRTIIIFITLFLCLHANAEECFRLKASKEEISHIQVGRLFTKSDTIMSLSKGAISGLSISGSFEKKSDDYLIRIILMDKSGHEHLVMESYDMLNSDFKVTMDDYCEETAFLEDVEPDYIKVIVNDATLIIDNIGYTTSSQRDSNQAIEWTAQKAEVKKEQRNSIIKRINTYNIAHNKIWRAGVTELSKLNYEQKRRILGFSDALSTEGYEYYIDGIYEIGVPTLRNEQESSPYVDNFDWRNRHGRKWITPVKNQYLSKYCFIFAPIACTEAMYKLYFNEDRNIILSEQNVARCGNVGDPGEDPYDYGGYAWKAIDYIAMYGVCDYDSYPYEAGINIPCKLDQINPQTNVKIAGRRTIDYEYDDSIKHAVINYGPLVSGYWYWTDTQQDDTYGHSMAIVGYGTVHEGDTIRYFNDETLSSQTIIQHGDYRIGCTYWIFKNSMGGYYDSNHGGYQYIIFHDNYYMMRIYALNIPITATVDGYTKSEADIICEDLDGDGYYFWGIGPKPSWCPSWIPDTKDGDDNDSTKGSMNQYGNLETLNPNFTFYINGNVTYSTQQSVYANIRITSNSKLTVNNILNMFGRVKITIESNGQLIIDGGVVTNADVNMMAGAKLTIKNGGKLVMQTGKDFVVPIYALLDIDEGEIIRSNQ